MEDTTTDTSLGSRGEHSRAAAGKPLTEREMGVLRLICDGHTNVGIGKQLGLSVKTIEAHRNRIFVKLDARNVAVAVRKAIRAGLIEA